MGGYVKDDYVASLLQQLNLRFGSDGVKEMVSLQREFAIFSNAHSLRDAFALIGIGFSHNPAQTRGWYRYLDDLSKDSTRRKGMTASETIIMTLKDHLEKTTPPPAPVHFTVHDATRSSSVLVSGPKPALIYSPQPFLIISLPVTSVQKNRLTRRSGK